MKYGFTIFLFLFCSSVFSQNELPEIKRNNALYLAHDFFLSLSANYERSYEISEKVDWGLRLGLGRDYGNKSTNAIAGISWKFGKKIHFFELQIGYEQPFQYSDSGPDPPVLAFMAGYRRESAKGILFKAYGEFIPAIFPDPESWGHLPFVGLAIGKIF